MLQRTACLAALAATFCAPGWAHDTWFQPLPGPGVTTLALGTGNRFPTQESAIGAEYLVRQGCRVAGAAQPMTALKTSDTALLLATPPGATTCWAQSAPFEIELPADMVRLYLDEVRAPAAVRQRWAAMQARGLPWLETYSKHARIDLRNDAIIARSTPVSAGNAASRSEVDSNPARNMERDIDSNMSMAIDATLLPGPTPTRAGQPLVFQVTRAGVALAGFPVELRTELSPMGIWRQTDAKGQVRANLPLAGRWLLRGTELQPTASPPGEPERWTSHFVTLAFSLAPAEAAVKTATP